jgi:hypothetical protein
MFNPGLTIKIFRDRMYSGYNIFQHKDLKT